jgi:hypothetical protein
MGLTAALWPGLPQLRTISNEATARPNLKTRRRHRPSQRDNFLLARWPIDFPYLDRGRSALGSHDDVINFPGNLGVSVHKQESGL